MTHSSHTRHERKVYMIRDFLTTILLKVVDIECLGKIVKIAYICMSDW